MENLWVQPKNVDLLKTRDIVLNFLDVATTSMGRATHYNTKEEQQTAEIKVHQDLMNLSRELYSVLLMLPGVLDRAKQLGTRNLLSVPPNGVQRHFVSATQERDILGYLMQQIPPQRLLKIIDTFRVGDEAAGIKKANNARTRKLVLHTLLSSPKLPFWCVKYRNKIKRALTHVWGKRLTSIIREILKKVHTKKVSIITKKEGNILCKNITKFVGSNNIDTVYESIKFVLGVRDQLTMTLFTDFERSKIDYHAGKNLPLEVLEGICSTYHKDIKRDKLIELTKDSLTKNQKMNVQRQAKKSGIDVEMNPLDYDTIRLYVYAFEMGLTDEITKALDQKAKKSAKSFPIHYDNVGIIVDVSKSMEGDKTQPLRPLATALALRDMLQYTAKHGVISFCGGDLSGTENGRLPRPQGATALGEAIITVLEENENLNAIFLISDGYENSPAGRTHDVVSKIRDIGILTPIYHLNPVFAAESQGTRCLSALIPTMPVQRPELMHTAFIRAMIEADPTNGINALINTAFEARKQLCR